MGIWQRKILVATLLLLALLLIWALEANYIQVRVMYPLLRNPSL